MKRCFIGMRLDASATEQLGERLLELARLPPSAARRLRPVARESLHVTVKFLGATADVQVPQIVAAMTEVAQSTVTTPVIVGGFSAFPSPDRPRHVIATLRHGQELITTLGARLDEILTPLGFGPEPKKRTPHITLARVDAARAHGELCAWLAAAPTRSLGALVSEELILFASTLEGERRCYSPLAKVVLPPKLTHG